MQVVNDGEIADMQFMQHKGTITPRSGLSRCLRAGSKLKLERKPEFLPHLGLRQPELSQSGIKPRFSGCHEFSIAQMIGSGRIGLRNGKTSCWGERATKWFGYDIQAIGEYFIAKHASDARALIEKAVMLWVFHLFRCRAN